MTYINQFGSSSSSWVKLTRTQSSVSIHLSKWCRFAIWTSNVQYLCSKDNVLNRKEDGTSSKNLEFWIIHLHKVRNLKVLKRILLSPSSCERVARETSSIAWLSSAPSLLSPAWQDLSKIFYRIVPNPRLTDSVKRGFVWQKLRFPKWKALQAAPP